MLPLSAYREAIHLDEPFDRPKPDPRSDHALFNAVLAGLPEGHLSNGSAQVSSIEELYDMSDIQDTLRLTLMGLSADEISEDALDAINVLLYRNSAALGRTTGNNLMRISEMMPTSDYGSARNVAMWRGDVRELVADAVVNAALPSLQGCTDPDHPCIDNFIHAQAGPWLRDDCKVIREKQGRDDQVGGAKLTRAYRMPANYVLHTVSPRLEGAAVTDADRAALASCYTSCLDLALEKGDIHTVSFCALSTGENGFPFEEATKIALSTVNNWLHSHGSDQINLVIFNIFEDPDARRYIDVLQHWIED
ncbi:MAG: macro domain-containing protein [Ancrocorticia sp.]|uniref:macro domain-containing protein n=1 Tax=Ancrocorticia sp. TaxID=2593684 RepID=UPI003F8EF4FD